MQITELSRQVQDFLLNLPDVKACRLYGSLSTGTHDEYSDVDMEVDVSGTDNGLFATMLPSILAQQFDVIFADFAPSLAPEKYVLSVALDPDNPFGVVDLAPVAVPHCASVSREALARRNNRYDHTLKLFSANLKHALRRTDCTADVSKMYHRVFGADTAETGVREMLVQTWNWLWNNAEDRHRKYVRNFRPYLDRL